MNGSETSVFVQGGFGALGNSSSFHCPPVRKLRELVQNKAQLFFQALQTQIKQEQDKKDEKNTKLPPLHNNFEQLMDRVLYRDKSKKPTPETWHRDVAPFTNKNDMAFGGWVNLDLKENQYFNCVKGTHLPPHLCKKGFAKIDKKEAEKYDKIKESVCVPPGHWILFFQTICHEVRGDKLNHNTLRQFVGFRLTNETKPLFDNIPSICDYQGVPFIPSGQTPMMYSSNHWSYEKNRENLEEWSLKTFIPKMLEIKQLKEKKEKKEKKDKKEEKKQKKMIYTVVKRVCPSLFSMDLPMYPTYTDAEIDIFYPQPIFSSPMTC